jgi:(p)ppGpp synthase/HD superfamily hydrolase
VEIVTSQQAHPVEHWLDFVVSSKAKSQIGVEVKRLSGDRGRIIEKGKKMLFDTFKTVGIVLDDHLSNFALYYGSVLDEKKRNELFYHIGDGTRKASSFLPRKEHKKKVSFKKIETLPVSVII